jgi:uncharacterized protein (DUF2062 family)
MTMVTNPLTISFWLWLAYQLGALILGEPRVSVPPQDVGALEWLAAFGWPTLLGMGLFAVGGAAGGYLGVKLFWRLHIWTRRRARRTHRWPGVELPDDPAGRVGDDRARRT